MPDTGGENPGIIKEDIFETILRSTYHQADMMIFPHEFAGSQCTAMAIASLITAFSIPPASWTVKVLDEILIEGDMLHSSIHEVSTIGDERGFLALADIPRELIIKNRLFKISIMESSSQIGQLIDSENVADFWTPLKPALESFFELENFGLLIALEKSYGVFKSEEAFFLFDSHPCDDQGQPVHDGGKACVIKTESIEELVQIVKSKTDYASGDYSIDAIKIDEIA